MHNIISQLEKVLYLTDTHASRSQLSAFTFGEKALKNFVSMVVRDVRLAFTNIDNFVQDYELTYGRRRSNLLQELDGIVNKLISIFDIIRLGKDPEARVTELVLACMNAEDLIDVILGEPGITDYNKLLTYLPSKLYLSKVNKEECKKSLRVTKLNVKDVANQMEKKKYFENDTFELATSIEKNINRLRQCINEMGRTLSSAKQWFEENEFAKNNTADILDYEMYFDYNTTLARLNGYVTKYSAMLQDLAEHKITKLNLAKNINRHEIEHIEGYLKTTQATINKQVYTTLENAIGKVEKESISTYHDVMSHLSNIQQYYTKGNQDLADQARQMDIFYKPFISDDIFGLIAYTSKTATDTYEIWPLNKDFKEFAEKEARDHLTKFVKTHFRPVYDAMSEAMKHIQLHGDFASKSLNDFMELLDLYAKNSLIDKDFK